MQVEVVQKIEEMAQQAIKPVVIATPGEPPHKYLIWNPRISALEEKEASPAIRQHTAGSYETVVALCDTWANDTELPGKPAIWYDRDGITGIMDAEIRRDRIIFKTSASAQMHQLALLAKEKTWMDQKSMVLMLRSTFKGCLNRNADILAQMRKIDWKKMDEGVASEEHGKRSVSREVQEAIKAEKALPEYLYVDVPVFNEACLSQCRFTMECVFDIDVANRTFKFYPLPGQSELAWDAGEKFIEQSIRDSLQNLQQTGVPVYYGKL